MARGGTRSAKGQGTHEREGDKRLHTLSTACLHMFRHFLKGWRGQGGSQRSACMHRAAETKQQTVMSRALPQQKQLLLQRQSWGGGASKPQWVLGGFHYLSDSASSQLAGIRPDNWRM